MIHRGFLSLAVLAVASVLWAAGPAQAQRGRMGGRGMAGGRGFAARPGFRPGGSFAFRPAAFRGAGSLAFRRSGFGRFRGSGLFLGFGFYPGYGYGLGSYGYYPYGYGLGGYGYGYGLGSYGYFPSYGYALDDSYYPAGYGYGYGYGYGGLSGNLGPADSGPPVLDSADLAAPTDNTARVRVLLPADAQLWFEDKPTTQRGPVRDFSTPKLTPGSTYVYTIRARWRENDGWVDETGQFPVRANTITVVRFPLPRREQLPPPRAVGPATRPSQ